MDIQQTIDQSSGIIDTIERVISTVWFQECFAGAVIIVIAAAGTELVKNGLRQWTRLTDDWTPRAVALLIGFLLTPVIWPAASGLNPWVMGLALTLVAPTVYPLIVRRFKREYPAESE